VEFLYRITKYGIIYFVLCCVFQRIFKAFLCLLVVYCSFNPSIVIAATDINVSDHLKTIFHLIWAICLGFSAVYMYRRKVSLAQINDILLAIGLPIVSTTI
jgi:hypothetical protein